MRRFLLVVTILIVALIVFLARRDPSPTVVDTVASSAERQLERADLAQPPIPPRAEVEPNSPLAFSVVEAVTPSEARPEVVCVVTFVLVPPPGTESTQSSYVSCTDQAGRGMEEVRVDEWTFVSRDVSPGSYRVVGFAASFPRVHATFDITPADHEKRVELELRTASADGAPVSRAVLVRWQTSEGEPFLPALATAWSARFRPMLAIRRDDGTFVSALPVASPTAAFIWPEALARENPGTPTDAITRLEVRTDGDSTFQLTLDSVRIATFRVAERQHEVVVRSSIDALLRSVGSVRGCLVSGLDRAPVPEFAVGVGEFPPRWLQVKGSSSPGCFRIDGQGAGPVRLRYEVGVVSFERTVEILAGSEVDVGEIVVPEGCGFHMRFTHDDGTAVGSVQYVLFARETRGGAGPVMTSLSRSQRGSFRKDSAPVDGAIVVASESGRGLAAFELPPCGQRDDEFELQLVPGVEVLLDVGLGTDAESVLLATADGMPLGEHPTTATGLVTVELAPGVYMARRSLKSEPTPFVVGAKPTVVRVR